MGSDCEYSKIFAKMPTPVLPRARAHAWGRYWLEPVTRPCLRLGFRRRHAEIYNLFRNLQRTFKKFNEIVDHKTIFMTFNFVA